MSASRRHVPLHKNETTRFDLSRCDPPWDTIEDGIDDLLGHPAVERGVPVQEPVVERPEEQVEGELNVGRRSDLPSPDGALEGLTPSFATDCDEPLSPDLAELGIVVTLRDQTGDDAGVRPAGHPAHPRSHDADEVGPERVRLPL